MKKISLVILFSLIFANIFAVGATWEPYYSIKPIKHKIKKLSSDGIKPSDLPKEYRYMHVYEVEDMPELKFKFYAKSFYIGNGVGTSLIVMDKTKQRFDIYKNFDKDGLYSKTILFDYRECYIFEYKTRKYLTFLAMLGGSGYNHIFVFDITDKNNINLYTCICNSLLEYHEKIPFFGEFNGQLCFFAGIYDKKEKYLYSAPFIIKNGEFQEMVGKNGKKYRVYFDWNRYGHRMHRFKYKTF